MNTSKYNETCKNYYIKNKDKIIEKQKRYEKEKKLKMNEIDKIKLRDYNRKYYNQIRKIKREPKPPRPPKEPKPIKESKPRIKKITPPKPKKDKIIIIQSNIIIDTNKHIVEI